MKSPGLLAVDSVNKGNAKRRILFTPADKAEYKRMEQFAKLRGMTQSKDGTWVEKYDRVRWEKGDIVVDDTRPWTAEKVEHDPPAIRVYPWRVDKTVYLPTGEKTVKKNGEETERLMRIQIKKNGVWIRVGDKKHLVESVFSKRRLNTVRSRHPNAPESAGWYCKIDGKETRRVDAIDFMKRVLKMIDAEAESYIAHN